MRRHGGPHPPDTTRWAWHGVHTVYRCYGDGQLLYVGTSRDVCERLKQHRRESSWYGQTDRIVVKVYRGPREACAAELAAIRAERPLHNVRHVASWVEPALRRRAS